MPAPSFSIIYVIASISVSLPSASVLFTSIVFPAIEPMMSPGLKASLDNIFSQAATTATTFFLSLFLAIALIVPITAAAPAISSFISIIPVGGFKENPPES